jgi:hypothetical protein
VAEDISDFTAKDLEQGQEHLTLGPAYFAARRVMQEACDSFDTKSFEPVLKKTADDFHEMLLENVQEYLWSNAEVNLQGKAWRMVDQCVQALLSGERWAMEKYALGERYDCAKVRATVARHVPKELQDARIADLEAEVKRLNEQLGWHRDR